MITLNNKTKISTIVKRQWVAEVFIVIVMISLTLSLISGSFFQIFSFFLIFLGLPLTIYSLIHLNSISFVVEDDKITINYGIIVKHSNTIPYRNIQNILNRRSVSGQLFRVTTINIWTAAPNQIDSHNERKPDGKLYLPTLDANWLKDFILNNNSNKKSGV